MPFLKREFFARDTLTVARDLIGTVIVAGGVEGRIVEVEAYKADAASHTVMRPNKALIMAETFGYLYIYFIYGMHYCMNFTTDRNGAGAVLIRAVEPVRGIKEMQRRRGTEEITNLGSGPGKVCQAFGIDLSFTGKPIGKEVKVRPRTSAPIILTSKRIGITRATDLEWRFYEAGSPFVSGPKAIARKSKESLLVR
jgi:DNA-3-methyladenine glycosylase